ncbi:MAG: YhcH/YjgK/YiaL family protein [Lachnospiraceae bacterium]|jgi:YhcH/YjgK/YiaL family protein|nr:YhcH/YjgK/YiaL family protein [Lachnospiraceae bacterium]
MIYGNVHSPMIDQQIAMLPGALQSAIRFLKETDLAVHEPGKFDMELNGVPMILQVLDLSTAPRETLRPEIHRKNIDVQFLASGGPERAGYYSDDGNGQVDENLLDTPRDILFYHNNPAAYEGTIEMTVGTYAIYFPWDVHIPAIQVGDSPVTIRKIVIKVPVDAC